MLAFSEQQEIVSILRCRKVCFNRIAYLGTTFLLLGVLSASGCSLPWKASRHKTVSPRITQSALECPVSEVDSPCLFDSLPNQPGEDGTQLGETSATTANNDQVQLVALQLPLSMALPKDNLNTPAPVLTLSLASSINLALERNPNLATIRASEPVAHAAFHAAEIYPWNPQFQTQVLPYSRDRNGNSGAVSQQHTVVQTFEFGGQQRFREGAAAANWRQVGSTVRQAELTTAAQTVALYFAVLYQRELRDLNESLADTNEKLIGVMERREKAAQANSADVQLTRLQAQSSRRQQRLTEASYRMALSSLQTQLNLVSNLPVVLEGDEWLNWHWNRLDDIVGSSAIEGETLESHSSALVDQPSGWELKQEVALVTPESEAMLRQLISDRPDVAAARAGVAVALQNLRLAKAMKRPSLQIGPMWQRDDAATEFWGLQAQVDIPVVNTGQALVAQRCAELRQQQITAKQVENQAVLAARAAIQRYERSRRLADASREDFTRAMTESQKPFEDQFKAGQITVLQVFAGQAALAQSRQSYLDLLNELTLAVADVAGTTGIPPQLLMSDVQSVPESAEELPQP